jgi:hypothetical protein
LNKTLFGEFTKSWSGVNVNADGESMSLLCMSLQQDMPCTWHLMILQTPYSCT